MALNKFTNKRILSLEEVKKIIIHTTKEGDNSQISREIVFIGIKIIFRAIKPKKDTEV